jgi:hypothetical protein
VPHGGLTSDDPARRDGTPVDRNSGTDEERVMKKESKIKLDRAMAAVLGGCEIAAR